MKTIVMGNSGSGKTTLARRLARREDAACLGLDEIAFAEGAERRPLEESVELARRFIDGHARWILEGCYGDLIERLLPCCEALVWLDPGVEVCLAHCRARPWEPDKFPSREAQDAHLPHLLEWVASYETRDDEYGRRCHRRVFDAFPGRKIVLDRADLEAEALPC